MVLPGRRLPGQQIRRTVPWARQALGTAETMLERVKARGFLPANYRIEALLVHKVDLAYAIHQYEKWELRDREARIRESLWSQPLADWMDARRDPVKSTRMTGALSGERYRNRTSDTIMEK